jgi:hypothetical protein
MVVRVFGQILRVLLFSVVEVAAVQNIRRAALPTLVLVVQEVAAREQGLTIFLLPPESHLRVVEEVAVLTLALQTLLPAALVS